MIKSKCKYILIIVNFIGKKNHYIIQYNASVGTLGE
jgi:hypothetical protein